MQYYLCIDNVLYKFELTNHIYMHCQQKDLSSSSLFASFDLQNLYKYFFDVSSKAA